MISVNLSYIKLKHDVKDDYTKSLKGWKHKAVNWKDLDKVLGDSTVQFSYLKWKNGVKKGKNVITDDVNCIVLDSDDGFTIAQTQKLLRKYSYVIGTSKSHMLEKKGVINERFRVIIPCINASRDIDVLLRSIEIMFYWNDRQTEIKTASFLGNSKAIVIFNEGKMLDMHNATELAEEQLKSERVEKKVIDKDLMPNTGVDVDMVKESLNKEIVEEVLESIGIEFNASGKCKLRPEESTESCKVYPSGYIKDYGSDEMSGDIFNALMELEGMGFIQAVRYVRNFI